MTQPELDALLAEGRAQREALETRALQHALELARLKALLAARTAEVADLRERLEAVGRPDDAPLMAVGERSADTRHD